LALSARHACAGGSYRRGVTPIAPIFPPLAAVVVEFVVEVMGPPTVSTALFAGVFRAVAILRKSSDEQVERMMAVGFFGGAAFGALMLVLDFVLG